MDIFVSHSNKYNRTEHTTIIKKQNGFENEKVSVKEFPGENHHLKRFVVIAPLVRKDELYNTAFWP